MTGDAAARRRQMEQMAFLWHGGFCLLYLGALAFHAMSAYWHAKDGFKGVR